MPPEENKNESENPPPRKKLSLRGTPSNGPEKQPAPPDPGAEEEPEPEKQEPRSQPKINLHPRLPEKAEEQTESSPEESAAPEESSEPSQPPGKETETEEELPLVFDIVEEEGGKEPGPETPAEPSPPAGERKKNEEDPLLAKAVEIAESSAKVSPTMLQRRLHVDYARAVELIKTLEKQGLAGSGKPEPPSPEPAAPARDESGITHLAAGKPEETPLFAAGEKPAAESEPEEQPSGETPLFIDDEEEKALRAQTQEQEAEETEPSAPAMEKPAPSAGGKKEKTAAAAKKKPSKKVLAGVLAGGFAGIAGVIWLLSVIIAAIFGGKEEPPAETAQKPAEMASAETFQAEEFAKPITRESPAAESAIAEEDLPKTIDNAVDFVANLKINEVYLKAEPPFVIIDHVAYPVHSILEPDLGLKIIAIKAEKHTIVLRDAEGNNYIKPFRR